jgi:hypothetical protein
MLGSAVQLHAYNKPQSVTTAARHSAWAYSPAAMTPQSLAPFAKAPKADSAAPTAATCVLQYTHHPPSQPLHMSAKKNQSCTAACTARRPRSLLLTNAAWQPVHLLRWCNNPTEPLVLLWTMLRKDLSSLHLSRPCNCADCALHAAASLLHQQPKTVLHCRLNRLRFQQRHYTSSASAAASKPHTSATHVAAIPRSL